MIGLKGIPGQKKNKKKQTFTSCFLPSTYIIFQFISIIHKKYIIKQENSFIFETSIYPREFTIVIGHWSCDDNGFYVMKAC